MVENYTFQIQVFDDGECTYTKMYVSALDAVNAYNRFTDHGMCRFTREVVLIEPTGRSHNKMFAKPMAVLT